MRSRPMILSVALLCAAGTVGPGPFGVEPLAAAAQTDSLEALAERVTRAVVLVDVSTATDSRQGSGFLVDSSGRILTNEHVIRGARSVRVKLASGDVHDAVDILAVVVVAVRQGGGDRLVADADGTEPDLRGTMR